MPQLCFSEKTELLKIYSLSPKSYFNLRLKLSIVAEESDVKQKKLYNVVLKCLVITLRILNICNKVNVRSVLTSGAQHKGNGIFMFILF